MLAAAGLRIPYGQTHSAQTTQGGDTSTTPILEVHDPPAPAADPGQSALTTPIAPAQTTRGPVTLPTSRSTRIQGTIRFMQQRSKTVAPATVFPSPTTRGGVGPHIVGNPTTTPPQPPRGTLGLQRVGNPTTVTPISTRKPWGSIPYAYPGTAKICINYEFALVALAHSLWPI